MDVFSAVPVEAILKEDTTFKITASGKTIGSIVAKRGSVVKVVSESGTLVTLKFKENDEATISKTKIDYISKPTRTARRPERWLSYKWSLVTEKDMQEWNSRDREIWSNSNDIREAGSKGSYVSDLEIKTYIAYANEAQASKLKDALVDEVNKLKIFYETTPPAAIVSETSTSNPNGFKSKEMAELTYKTVVKEWQGDVPLWNKLLQIQKVFLENKLNVTDFIKSLDEYENQPKGTTFYNAIQAEIRALMPTANEALASEAEKKSAEISDDAKQADMRNITLGQYYALVTIFGSPEQSRNLIMRSESELKQPTAGPYASHLSIYQLETIYKDLAYESLGIKERYSSMPNKSKLAYWQVIYTGGSKEDARHAEEMANLQDMKQEINKVKREIESSREEMQQNQKINSQNIIDLYNRTGR